MPVRSVRHRSRGLHLQRRLLRGVLVVVRHPRLTLAVSAVALAACVVFALLRLSIDTDQDRLFSPNVGFFKDYLEFIKKFPENEALYVLIEPSDKTHPPALARWTALADQITAKLNHLDGIVTRAEGGVPVNQMGEYGLLFLDRASLGQEFESARHELAPLAQAWGPGGSPMRRFLLEFGLSQPDADKADFIGLLADSWAQSVRKGNAAVPDLAALSAKDPRDLGYFYVQDQSDPANHLLLIQVYLAEDDSSLTAESKQVDTIRDAAVAAGKDFPEFHVAITGRPVLEADEMRTSDTDSTHAEIIALVVVFVGLAVMLGSVWLAVAAEISLVVAIGWTFGYATAAVGELNILSMVFLITLIGIGMDYLVQILMRYRREFGRYERPEAVWMRVFKHVSPPIFTACLGAAGAFLVAVFTDFRGAAELGIVAGGGLLLCLTAGYTVLPALLVLLPPKHQRVAPGQRYASHVGARVAWRRLLLPACWVIVLAVILPFARRIYFNPNLLELQAQNLESVKLVRKLQTWYAVVTSPDLGMLRQVRDAVKDLPSVGSVESIVDAEDNYDWLQQHRNDMPRVAWGKANALTDSDLAAISQSARAMAGQYQAAGFPRAAAALTDFLDALSTAPATAAGALSQWQTLFAQELRSLLARFSPPPLRVSALPDELRNHLVSSDGTYALYVYPKENLWQRGPLKQFVNDLENRTHAIPNHPPVTGIAPQIFHSTHSIEMSFYKATGYALGLVLILVYLDLRNVGQTLLTVSVLGLGLPMLVGLMGLLGINWNFANFFGLPILIGAGHEYGVFMMHRYREAMEHPRRTWTRWDASDRALLLCAFVTTSSFAFFWAMGHHEGLRSLGLVMALGTMCIYLAAVLVVRPLLKWKIDRARRDAAANERAGHSTGKSLARNVP